MNIVLRPDLQKYIDELVKAGRYGSAEGVVEDALSRFILEDVGEEIDDETDAALQRSEVQIQRGEVMGLDVVRERFRRPAK